jgi:UDP-3-O-[3-hydroxymyristoyl] N-acetylglucosamine deacetylase
VQQYMCTGIQGTSGSVVRTVEHLLASLSAFGIDNAIIEIEGEELPILDGSALPWCHSILKAGLAEQDAPRRYLRIMRPVELVEDPGRWLRIEPADSFSLRVTSDPPGFGLLTWDGEPSPERFLREIAPSRSHGPLIGYFAKLFFALTRQSRLRGVSFRTVAFTVKGRYLGGMRIPDEPVRHRVLDLLGDLALTGMPLLGRVTGHGTSHRLNNLFVRTLMESTDAWQEVTFSDESRSG